MVRASGEVSLCLDTSGEEPSVVFRKDMDRQGWALGMPLKEEIKLFVSQWRLR